MIDHVLFLVLLLVNLIRDTETKRIETFQVLTTVQPSLHFLEVPDSKNPLVIETIIGRTANPQGDHEVVGYILRGEFVAPGYLEIAIEQNDT